MSPIIARLVTAPVSQDEIVRDLLSPERGAILVFSAVVRNHGAGRSIAAVSYDARAPLARRAMEEIGEEALARWGPDLGVTVVHRTGRVQVGEACLVVGVASVHREEAFQAARWILEQFKLRSPLRKHEHYAGRDGARRGRRLRRRAMAT
jgi:molybdopterin synthase catalytic subunit